MPPRVCDSNEPPKGYDVSGLYYDIQLLVSMDTIVPVVYGCYAWSIDLTAIYMYHNHSIYSGQPVDFLVFTTGDAFDL